MLVHDTSSVPGANTLDDVSSLQNWTLAEDGWIIDDQGHSLLWVPHDDRRSLWRPRNTAVFGSEYFFKLDLTWLALSIRWSSCFKSPE